MKTIARVVATAALVSAAVLTAGGVAQADGGQIDWPVAPGTSAAPAGAGIDWPVAPATGQIDWP
ncbi:hypothetical protein ABZ128_05695 [Streptomyces sp. NPDC006326]|uniref:hypothetical protein n=1 Tax=Streptomyces sp. NPDC006326 TaxID=3156752 RepID=UPI00339F79F6